MEEFAGTMLYNGSTARPDQAGATPANRQAFGGNSAVYNPSASRVLKIEDNASHGLSGTKLQVCIFGLQLEKRNIFRSTT
jgi:hypothetical protein